MFFASIGAFTVVRFQKLINLVNPVIYEVTWPLDLEKETTEPYDFWHNNLTLGVVAQL